MKGSNRKLYFGEYLIEQGLLAEANVLKALEAQRKETPNFERMALKLSLLSVKEVFQLLTRQADSDLSIAELALRDGYLDAEQVMDVLNEVDRVRPSFGDVLVSLGMLTSAAMETELNRHLMAVSQYEKIQEALRQVEFFRHLDKGSLRSLANIAEKLTLGAQRQVVTEGEPADSFYAVVDGYLRITKENPKEGAEPVYIGNIGANDVFGEASIFEEAYRTANVITETETVLLRFRRKPFLLFLKNHPAGSQSILVFIIQRLLKKLESTNKELSFERKDFLVQEDVQDLLDDFFP